MKNEISGMLRRMALIITDVSEELSPSIIRVTRIDELGTVLAVTSNNMHPVVTVISHATTAVLMEDFPCP
jgi:hypothetical protein